MVVLDCPVILVGMRTSGKRTVSSLDMMPRINRFSAGTIGGLIFLIDSAAERAAAPSNAVRFDIADLCLDGDVLRNGLSNVPSAESSRSSPSMT